MKTIDVEIKGTTSLLMNSAKAMLDEKKVRKTTKGYDSSRSGESSL